MSLASISTVSLPPAAAPSAPQSVTSTISRASSASIAARMRGGDIGMCVMRTPAGVRHRIGDRRQRRHDRRFADAAHAVRMVGVGNLEDLRVDERQVGAHRNAVVEEARVLQPPVLAVDVLLVERPADALRRAALELALDVGRMNRLAGVLDHRVAQHLRGAGFGIDLDVADMGGEGNAGAVGDDLVVAGDRAAGVAGGRGDLLQRQRREIAVLLAPAAIAWPSSQSTSSTAMSHILAARSLSTLIALRAAKIVAMPGRERAAAALGHVVVAEAAVSATTHLTCS